MQQALQTLMTVKKNYKKAYQINYLGAKNIAQICKNLKIKLVHLSTDHLFDGKKENIQRMIKLHH